MPAYAVFTVAFLGLTSWCLYRAFANRWRRLRLLHNPVEVRGEVIRVEDISSEGDTLTMFEAHVQYLDLDGVAHDTVLQPVRERKRFPVGSGVKLRYERGNPKNVTQKLQTWDVNVYCAMSLAMALLATLFVVDCLQKLEFRL